MDRHNAGYVTINGFGNGVRENCGFHIADEDLPALELCFDDVQDYRIGREDFIQTISVQFEEADDEEAPKDKEPKDKKEKAPKDKKEKAPKDKKDA